MSNESRDDIDERSETLPYPKQNLNETIPSTTKSGGTRKTRGRTLLKDLYELNFVKRVKVARNSHGQPIGSEAQLLAGYLGIIARNVNLLPINYDSWHHMPDSNKNQALDNVKDRERVRTQVGKNKNSSTQLELSSSQKVRCLQLFDITHRKKDESPMTTEAAEIMEKLKDKRAEYKYIASSDSFVNPDDIDNRIMTKVLGPERYGQVRFQGSFVNPTQYFGSSSRQYMPSGNQAQAEVQRLRDQMAQMQASTLSKLLNLKQRQHQEKQRLKENMKNSSYN
ncbi:hypothetical protein GOBAR_AA18186 [Gossypium barbadense]|uniref:Uncharacterized protein n=1 Tax=Gossypium barbadense TaxID=3634 RepID=A0A2P5XGR1_GOSBA|nr:hypothetical protein GOBAR_AA18186 [Gossypium barbadense]